VRVEPVEGPEVVQAVDGFQEAIQVELGAEQLDGAWVSLEVLDGERVLATHRVQVEVRATPW